MKHIKMSYNRLGDYIQQVNVRNKNLDVETLLGVSNTKKLIPSIANTVGTDMSTYKIIEKRQFAYGTVTSRNGDRLSVALSEEHDRALVSQIYIVFEVKDQKVLSPDYLMMWFSRPEFDRYARFHSHGSTRESFDWEDMCEVELPVPGIEEQQKIVDQYLAIANKIKVNEQICKKLEATAQALYKHWFVDFEFPNEEGKPYKSSGGTMEPNEELQKEIPEGWEVKSLGEITDLISRGITPSYTEVNSYSIVINQKCIRDNKINYSYSRYHNQDLKKVSEEKFLKEYDVLINSTGDGTLGRTAFIKEILKETIVDSHVTILRARSPYKLFVANNLSDRELEISSLAEGSTGQTELNKEKVKELKVVISKTLDLYTKYNEAIQPLFNKILYYEKINPKLTQLQSLLLSRLATLDEEK